MAVQVDPGAVFKQTMADLGLTYNNEIGGIQENEGNLKTNIQGAENRLTESEPGVYRTEENRANKGGLLNSGINSRRKTDIFNNYAAKRTENQAKLSQGLGTFKREEEAAGIKKTTGEHGAEQRKTELESQYGVTNPGVTPAAPQTTPGIVPQAGGIAQRPGAAHIGPVGTVRVGGKQPPKLSATRYYNPLTRRWETRI